MQILPGWMLHETVEGEKCVHITWVGAESSRPYTKGLLPNAAFSKVWNVFFAKTACVLFLEPIAYLSTCKAARYLSTKSEYQRES